MTEIINWKEIEPLLEGLDLIGAIEEGFKAYSAGKVIVPPVGEMIFDQPPGECHIKYGFIKDDEYYVIKIASGFPGNEAHGIPTSQGMMLVFSRKTGAVEAILLDEGRLTDIRTAVAGVISSRWLAPKVVTGIGIIGTGIQARLQLDYHLKYFDSTNVWVWGRSREKVEDFIIEYEAKGVKVHTGSVEDLSAACNVIVTTTSAKEPILSATMINPGTHITAVGSDTPHKQEVDSGLFEILDIVVADSIPQCMTRGEIHQAIKAGTLDKEKIIELGASLASGTSPRINDDQITLADLTGVAVQDIQISKAVYNAFKSKKNG
jgi:ornithine cyclodeaminase